MYIVTTHTAPKIVKKLKNEEIFTELQRTYHRELRGHILIFFETPKMAIIVKIASGNQRLILYYEHMKCGHPKVKNLHLRLRPFLSFGLKGF